MNRYSAGFGDEFSQSIHRIFLADYQVPADRFQVLCQRGEAAT
jgi:hypothetical protein